MKTTKRLFLIPGILIFLFAVTKGKDKPQVNIEGLGLGYTSDWIIKLAETTNRVDLMEINFNSLKETIPNSGIFVPDTTGLKMNRVEPPKIDENMEKKL
jgi:hypothetical protein